MIDMLLACEYCGLVEMLAAGGVTTLSCAGTLLLAKLKRKKPKEQEEESEEIEYESAR
jgi:hypothetical protein